MPIDSARLIAIGDVHGCVHALDAVVDAIAPVPSDQLVFLGDLIDQGPNTRDVLDRLIELKQWCSLVLIQGNHEEMMYAARENEKALRYWENCGGVATLNSYRFGGSLKDIPKEHWILLDECRPYFETESHIFTHANYLPDVSMPLQPGYQLRWRFSNQTGCGRTFLANQCWWATRSKFKEKYSILILQCVWIPLVGEMVG